MQGQRLEVLEDDAAVAVDDALRQSRRIEEYSTHSGWSNGTASKSSGPDSAINSDHRMVPANSAPGSR